MTIQERLERSVRELLAPHTGHVCWPDHQDDRCPIGRARNILADIEIAKMDAKADHPARSRV